MTGALERIRAEWRRQIEAECFSLDHDDRFVDGELFYASLIYLHAETPYATPVERGKPLGWPWDVAWYKPRGRVRNLERAGALAIAEADRQRRIGLPAHGALQLLEKAVGALEEALAEAAL